MRVWGCDPLSEGAFHAGDVVNVVSDLPEDCLISRVTRHTLEADDWLNDSERERESEN